jgi:hypothetical protein
VQRAGSSRYRFEVCDFAEFVVHVGEAWGVGRDVVDELLDREAFQLLRLVSPSLPDSFDVVGAVVDVGEGENGLGERSVERKDNARLSGKTTLG